MEGYSPEELEERADKVHVAARFCSVAKQFPSEILPFATEAVERCVPDKTGAR